jgi:hypothetical protein
MVPTSQERWRAENFARYVDFFQQIASECGWARFQSLMAVPTPKLLGFNT